MKKHIKKTKFTAIDLENNLFDLAVNVMGKSSDPTKTNSAVGAYKAILQLQNIKIKAASLGLKLGKNVNLLS